MKKLFLATTIILFSLSCFSQQKKIDTTVITTFKIADFRALIETLDRNIDSKKLSADIFAFIQSRSAIKVDTIKNELPKTKPIK